MPLLQIVFTSVWCTLSLAAVVTHGIADCTANPKEDASFGAHVMLQHSKETVSTEALAERDDPALSEFAEMDLAPAAPPAVPPAAAAPVVEPAPADPAAAVAAPALATSLTDTNVPEFVKSCDPLTPEDLESIKGEIKEYEQDFRFQEKIKEAKGEVQATAGHQSIVKYLREKVLEPDWSVLELGCAAGGILRFVEDAYNQEIGPHGSLVGVELVTGWVRFAEEYYKSRQSNIDIYEGDITDFSIPDPYTSKTFDFVMLNDVMEHIQKRRYGCFFSQLGKVTHKGSIVYMHTPSPMAQLADKEQYYENVVPHQFVVTGMANAGFELVKFEYDKDTICETCPKLPKKLEGAKCCMNGWPKYTHNVYRKVQD